jgi:hypothetical protein
MISDSNKMVDEFIECILKQTPAWHRDKPEQILFNLATGFKPRNIRIPHFHSHSVNSEETTSSFIEIEIFDSSNGIRPEGNSLGLQNLLADQRLTKANEAILTDRLLNSFKANSINFANNLSDPDRNITIKGEGGLVERSATIASAPHSLISYEANISFFDTLKEVATSNLKTLVGALEQRLGEHYSITLKDDRVVITADGKRGPLNFQSVGSQRAREGFEALKNTYNDDGSINNKTVDSDKSKNQLFSVKSNEITINTQIFRDRNKFEDFVVSLVTHAGKPLASRVRA